MEKGEYNPYIDIPKLQHPLSEFELYAEDSSSMFLISDNEELLNRFKKSYPNYIVKYGQLNVSVKATGMTVFKKQI